RTSPTCSTGQRVAPTLGPTCLLHFQPGSYVALPIVIPPRWTNSNFPFCITRTSSGAPNDFSMTATCSPFMRHSTSTTRLLKQNHLFAFRCDHVWTEKSAASPVDFVPERYR